MQIMNCVDENELKSVGCMRLLTLTAHVMMHCYKRLGCKNILAARRLQKRHHHGVVAWEEYLHATGWLGRCPLAVSRTRTSCVIVGILWLIRLYRLMVHHLIIGQHIGIVLLLRWTLLRRRSVVTIRALGIVSISWLRETKSFS